MQSLLRVPKDEEEQWISSEELCTEGSSDEETHTTSVKTSHRKPKRNAKTEKRGISPLAQPPKTTETESTSTYQRDSKYLSPETHSSDQGTEERSTSGTDQPETLKVKTETAGIDAKVEKLDLGASSSQAHSSKYEETKEDSVESDIDLEIEKMIQWRPKRGSIKLPEFPEGMPVEVTTVDSVN